jgi:HSP20 family protein
MEKLHYDPFLKDLVEFRKEFDQMFRRFFGMPWMHETLLPMAGFVPPVEAFIDNKTKKYFLKVALPGINPEELKVQLSGNLLTLTGERKVLPETENLDFHHREIHYGKFERMLNLPEGVDTDRLMAEYKNGVLELSAPVITGALPRRIEIKTVVPEMKRVGA